MRQRHENLPLDRRHTFDDFQFYLLTSIDLVLVFEGSIAEEINQKQSEPFKNAFEVAFEVADTTISTYVWRYADDENSYIDNN